jgi:hypothetical protein
LWYIYVNRCYPTIHDVPKSKKERKKCFEKKETIYKKIWYTPISGVGVGKMIFCNHRRLDSTGFKSRYLPLLEEVKLVILKRVVDEHCSKHIVGANIYNQVAQWLHAFHSQEQTADLILLTYMACHDFNKTKEQYAYILSKANGKMNEESVDIMINEDIDMIFNRFEQAGLARQIQEMNYASQPPKWENVIFIEKRTQLIIKCFHTP